MVTDTATAARLGGVSVSTVRAWARYGAISATKTNGAWVIDVASLRHRISLGRRSVPAQLAQFRDSRAARTKAEELLELAALVPTRAPHRYIAVSSQGTDGYLVDTTIGSCTCKGWAYSAHCYHLLAATILENSTPATRLALAA